MSGILSNIATNYGSTSSSIPRDGLVAEYLLATNSLDTSGNGYDGTDTSVTYNGTYATYNGSAKTVVATDMYTTPEFSTSFWFSPISTSGGTQFLFTNGNAGGVEEGAYFHGGNLNTLQRFVELGGYTFLATSTGLTNGQWYHCVYMTTNAGQRLYIDNTLVASNGVSGTVAKFAPQEGLVIGGFRSGDYSNINAKKFRIYNRVLNTGEIAALYAEG